MRMKMRTQRCEACGAAFGCGADAGRCWCDDLTVDAAALARLRARFSRCLCPSCLRAVAAGAIDEVVDGAAPPSRPAA